MVALDWNSGYYFTSQKSKSRNKKMKMNRCRDGMLKSKGRYKSEGKYTEPHQHSIVKKCKDGWCFVCLSSVSPFLGGLLFGMPSLHLFISSDHVSSLFLAHYSCKNSFFFSIAYYFPQNTEIHGRHCTSINCKGGAAGFICTFTTSREDDFGLYLVVSSPDPTYERGSGDIWLISQASLMLITFRTEISLRPSQCRKDNL